MSSVVISGDSSGTVSLTVPSVAGTNTATLPAATGTVMVSGNMPAFSAYANANQSISNTTYTKIQINTKIFDTASCFNNTGSTVGGIPAYAFKPNVAGYYQINAGINASAAASGTFCFTALYVNGTAVSLGSFASNNLTTGLISSNSFLVYLNGSSDYVELYAYQNTGVSLQINGGATVCYFQAAMVRGA